MCLLNPTNATRTEILNFIPWKSLYVDAWIGTWIDKSNIFFQENKHILHYCVACFSTPLPLKKTNYIQGIFDEYLFMDFKQSWMSSYWKYFWFQFCSGAVAEPAQATAYLRLLILLWNSMWIVHGLSSNVVFEGNRSIFEQQRSNWDNSAPFSFSDFHKPSV